jgi:hypothetical protein
MGDGEGGEFEEGSTGVNRYCLRGLIGEGIGVVGEVLIVLVGDLEREEDI